MSGVRYVYWKDEDMWLGYLEDFPDYMTQGETLDDLKAHLLGLYSDLTDGKSSCVRQIGELDVS